MRPLKKILEIFFCKFYFYATNRPNGDDDAGALEQKYHKMILSSLAVFKMHRTLYWNDFGLGTPDVKSGDDLWLS